MTGDDVVLEIGRQWWSFVDGERRRLSADTAAADTAAAEQIERGVADKLKMARDCHSLYYSTDEARKFITTKTALMISATAADETPSYEEVLLKRGMHYDLCKNLEMIGIIEYQNERKK